VRLLANLNLNQGTTIIMVTHDSHIAAQTERLLFLSDGKITKEKKGLHLAKKKLTCPYCGGRTQPDDEVCPFCKKSLLTKKEDVIDD
jgi:energy-coupling factor transporter ATP-binding protein EcfA2